MWKSVWWNHRKLGVSVRRCLGSCGRAWNPHGCDVLSFNWISRRSESFLVSEMAVELFMKEGICVHSRLDGFAVPVFPDWQGGPDGGLNRMMLMACVMGKLWFSFNLLTLLKPFNSECVD